MSDGKPYYNGKMVWDLIDAMDLNFNRGNVVKYVCRAGRKEREAELVDLRKALDYLQRELDRLEVGVGGGE